MPPVNVVLMVFFFMDDGVIATTVTAFHPDMESCHATGQDIVAIMRESGTDDVPGMTIDYACVDAQEAKAGAAIS